MIIFFFSKDKEKLKYRQLFLEKDWENDPHYSYVELPDGTRRTMTKEEKNDKSLLPKGSKVFIPLDLRPSGFNDSGDFSFEFNGKTYHPGAGKSWKTNKAGMEKLASLNRLYETKGMLTYVLYVDDYPVTALTNFWIDTEGAYKPTYVVQTSTKVIQRCLLMSTDPGDIVLDITCGSGTTAYVAEQWGRRWITCDTSRISISLAKQRLMSSSFDFYSLAYPIEGVGSGFKYNTVPHITLGSLANEETSQPETLYDKPIIDISKTRITGPFTVEAVPAPVAKSFEEIEADTTIEADNSISRSGETLRQNNWIDELLKSGVRGKSGGQISFTRMESLSGTRFLQAHGETKEDNPKRVVVCFGPEHAPLEQRMVELALEEARTLKPKPEIILFCAFHFDSEARKDIEETNWPGIALLEAQMNADLLTDDLKKKRSSNESFWLIGQPDVQIKEIKSGDDKGKYTVEVNGFDYYNPKTGTVDSGGKGDIAMWMLDHDYDGRSLFPSQVFFPMAGAKEGWATLAKNLKAEIDEEKIEAFGGTVSLPFTAGKNVAVKIIDARGIESLKIIRL